MSYGFAELEFYFSPVMCICCIAVTAACSVGATLFACRKELRGKPAELVSRKRLSRANAYSLNVSSSLETSAFYRQGYRSQHIKI